MHAPRRSMTRNQPTKYPQKISRQDSMTCSESDSTPSRSPTERSPSTPSPKVAERRSSRSPRSEGKNPSMMAELESRFSQLEKDLNKTKDQLSFSKLQKRRSQKESEDAKKHLAVTMDNLQDPENQLQEMPENFDEQIKELRRIGQERDRAWQSELEALRKQQSVDSAALVEAVNEIHRLRMHNDMLLASESAYAVQAEKTASELHDLKQEMAGTVFLVKELRTRVVEFEESEAGYQELINVSHLQLEMAKDTICALQSELSKHAETLDSVANELEESKLQVCTLQETVRKMETSERTVARSSNPDGSEDEHRYMKSQLDVLHLEVQKLLPALEAAEISYQEEQIRSAVQIQSMYEAVDAINTDSGIREAKLGVALKEAKSEITELKLNLLDKETVLQGLCDLNESLNIENEMYRSERTGRQSESMLEEIAELKAHLMDKENELQGIVEENEMAKNAINAAWAAEQEALAKLEITTKAADKRAREAVVMAEQLETARAANSETEAELRRLNVQMQQWRKAAEVAMAILSSDDHGKVVAKTRPLDSDYVHNIKKTENSSASDVDECDSMKKNKNNMLKRFGVLLKKGQK